MNKHILKLNDTIRLGRVALKLVEFDFCDNSIEILKKHESSLISKESFAEEYHHVCRICLSKMASLANPLVSPCKCSGTMKFLHLKCLR